VIVSVPVPRLVRVALTLELMVPLNACARAD
jgi:hypothetical protein